MTASKKERLCLFFDCVESDYGTRASVAASLWRWIMSRPSRCTTPPSRGRPFRSSHRTTLGLQNTCRLRSSLAQLLVEPAVWPQRDYDSSMKGKRSDAKYNDLKKVQENFAFQDFAKAPESLRRSLELDLAILRKLLSSLGRGILTSGEDVKKLHGRVFGLLLECIWSCLKQVWNCF